MQPINIAIVRGDSLKKQETQVFEQFDKEKFNITACCGLKNIPSLEGVSLPVKRLRSSADTFVGKNFYKYLFGRYNMLFGLENELRAYDIAHTVELYNYYTLQAVRAKRLNTKLKVVTTVVDNTFGRFEYNYWPRFRMPPAYWREKINVIMQESIRGIDAFLAISSYSAELIRDLGAPQNKITIIPEGFVLPPVKKADGLIKKYGLEGASFYLSISRQVWEKGVYDVLYSWKMYQHSSPKAAQQILVMVGDGPEYANIDRLIKEFNLKANVKHIKTIPYEDLQQLYPHARALLLGSTPTRTWQEQYGYVLAEAIMHGCPVISTISGAIPEVIENAGILVPPANPVAIKDALLTIENAEKYQKLKEHCQQVKEKFSGDLYKERLIKAYFSVV
ncbi:MAG: hypothetical protein A3D53_02905 [Candidatus Magasanikbacteria bacterium RIFCSPHIGHO2_02_FULL_45_10]|uniref:Glycosyl transferase family 1 domain-containing protein n=1 Tax=Candidatus Magasanikbacteria bacterium RIFCSPHIGHO2_02_FULL_45_10 TaxID=1798679 RepID=A0A1F6M9Z5_9BACT|nr:MAG: hypothetical protein A3D53_02905 [Candidatus Magasanikbacteria bacterium RIFCSPHIGHO2_02_FULL_45_10]